MRGMSRQWGAALRMLLCCTVLLGVAYPLAITAVARTVVPDRADGQQVVHQGRVVGSALLGQDSPGADWFQPRPSHPGRSGENSGGSNLSPVSDEHRAIVRQRAQELRRDNPDAPEEIPADALTASASGLDPQISPEYARWQAPRVAAARGLPVGVVRDLVEQHVRGRSLGFLGQPRVNVLELNVAVAQVPRHVG
ncbi:K+-transporting ATPase ATPase C chain [Austwickia chelonae]|uniref:Potassium-transporting ATPase KdpC subunit n=1 Tax=Austwickia chelonae NBRC 105200 TaxID=1184607 RepID=K6VAE6_9MICO|nr:potassium-transporting ATPase subunit KdpC [Austwickia chelonae]GAB79208.1 potassium-transporting ATPase C chain [Austwickia chelonae NBRC 105200]SEW37228.1 K+-transporting ATPase ATPase C chain [Austwickia chelonae]